MVNAVRSPALRACSAFGISGADIGVFHLTGVPVFGHWETLGKRYASVVLQPSADCSYGARDHTLDVVFYSRHGMVGAVSHRLSPLDIKAEAASFGSLNMSCMSVGLSPSPHLVVLNATVGRVMSLANCAIVRVLCAPQAKC